MATLSKAVLNIYVCILDVFFILHVCRLGELLTTTMLWSSLESQAAPLITMKKHPK